MKKALLLLAALATVGGLAWWATGNTGRNLIPALVELVRLRVGTAKLDEAQISRGLRMLPPGNLRILHKWMQAEASGDETTLQKLAPTLKITVLPAMAANEQLHNVARLIFHQPTHQDEKTV